MNKIIGIILCLLGIAGFIFGTVMTVMAVRFLEWGRVLFYGMMALIFVEILVFGILKVKRNLDKN